MNLLAGIGRTGKAAGLLLSALLPAVLPAAAGADQYPYVKVSFISEQHTLQPGSRQWLGVLFEPEEHWYVYWRNPGDSGLATKIALTLPEGVAAGDIHWPAPKRMQAGHLVSYGYHRVLLMVPVHVDLSVPTGEALPVTAEVSWLVCREACIPGRGKFALSLPVARRSGEGARAAEFAAARRSLPVALESAGSRYRVNGEQVVLELPARVAAGSARLQIYPITTGLVDYGQPPGIERRDNRLVATFALNEYFTAAPEQFDFVLVAGPDRVLQGSARQY